MDETSAKLESIIGLDPGSVAEEQLGADERDALNEMRGEQPEPEAPAEPPPEPTTEQAGAEQAQQDEAEPALEEGDALPPWMDEKYLKRRPEDAENWRELRGQAKDFRKGLGEAQEAIKERDAELQRVRAEVEALRRQQQQPQQPPEPPADPVADPDAFRVQLQAQMDAQALDMSEQVAVMKYGQERVENAIAAFQTESATDQALAAAVYQTAPKDRWPMLVQEMERRATLREMGSDPVAYQNRLKEQALEQARAELAQQSEADKAAAIEQALSQREAIPSSIATAPGAGRNATSANGADWSGPAPSGAVFNSPLDR